MAAEFDLIERIRVRCARSRADVRLGIGDDAALLAVPAGQLLAVSTDTLVAGVHFPHATSPYDIGWKALAVNLSDLAAMGATPAWATLALTLPAARSDWVDEFSDGFAALAGLFDVALVGGDTTQGPLAVSLTVHGFVPEDAALRRDAARVGDGVFVTGTLGDAAAGLRCVEPRGERSATLQWRPAATSEFLVDRLNRPTPRVAQGLVLRGRAHACIDVSDGLVADLGHVCAASGVGALIDADRLPSSSALLAAETDPERALALQLGGGDDYELCFTAAADVEPDLLLDLARSGCAATRVGTIVAGAGVAVRDASGAPIEIVRAGWRHFA
jgi:thiamine-monophosphate kinase